MEVHLLIAHDEAGLYINICVEENFSYLPRKNRVKCGIQRMNIYWKLARHHYSSLNLIEDRKEKENVVSVVWRIDYAWKGHWISTAEGYVKTNESWNLYESS